MNEWKCRDCRTPVTGTAHLRLGRQLSRGSNALCLACVDKLAPKMSNGNGIQAFVTAYVGTQAQRNEAAALRERVTQLENILKDPRALERLLEDATTPNHGYKGRDGAVRA